MNWYKRYKLSSLQGEYWIDESGNAMFADGDVGDYNHEAHVIQSVQGRFADQEFMNGENVDWDGFKQSIANKRIQEAYQNPSLMQSVMQVMGITSPEQISSVGIEELAHALLLERGMTEEEIGIAEGQGDARLYAAVKWGWKRLENRNVETWTLTAKDLEAIANGLYDAYQEEAEMSAFNIWVGSTKKWYNDVPYEVIGSGDLRSLREFMNMRMASAK